MARGFAVTMDDKVNKELTVRINLDGKTKDVKISTQQDDREQFRAICRAIKAYEDELKPKGEKINGERNFN